VRGLRREEVAELAGLSEGWYARFETGRATLSLGAIGRIADALRLDPRERSRLIELARPELHNLSDPRAGEASVGLGRVVGVMRDFARASSSASSVEELGAAASLAVRDACGPASLAYMRAYAVETDDLPIVGVCGTGGDALVGHRQSCASVSYAMRHFLAGRAYGEYDLRSSPCPELRTRIDRVGVYAYHTQPIVGRNGLALLLGLALREPRAPTSLELHMLETAAAIAELALPR
jgi:transcriptional regulator with XRE-family HTH domain